MKNIILITLAILTVNFSHAQFALDNMESYGGGNAPILGGPWTSWDGSASIAMQSSSTQAQSGSLSGYVDDSFTIDPILKLGDKIFGSWGVKFSMYIPTGKIGYWNLQGTEAPGIQWVVGNIYMGNSGIAGDGESTGRVDLSTADEADDFVFQFPKDQWFDIVMNFDFNSGPSAATWTMWVNNVSAVPEGTPYADGTGQPAQSLGGINFFSIDSNNEMYLDDVEMIDAFYSDPSDTIDPLAACQDITVQLDANGTVSINGIDIDGGSTDNNGIAFYTAVPDTFSCNDIGINSVTLIVTDGAGNTDTCTAMVTIEDNLSPNLIGQNATGNLSGTGSVTIPISNVDNGSSDNCGIANLTLSPDTFTNVGAYNAVLEGTDASGNSDDVAVVITIIDNADSEDPVAACQDITVQLDTNGTVAISGINIDGGSTDNIGIVSYTAVPNIFSCNNLGSNAVTLIVTDALGNTDACSAIVTVEDNLNPNVIGQNTIGNLNGAGFVTIPASNVNNGSTDNCNLVSLNLTPNTFTSTGAYPAVLEGTDPSGNSDEVAVVITIVDTVDNQDPIAICQDITVQLNDSGIVVINGNSIDDGSTDNTGIVSYTALPNSFNCNDLGTNSVTLTVTDSSGNTDTCTAIVTVEDNIDPNIIGQNTTGNLNGASSITIPVSSVDIGSFDNCGLANLTLTPNTFNSVGTNASVLEGTDTFGNSGSANITITIIDAVDNLDPIAVCQDITVQLNISGTVVINANSIDGGSTDNIGIVSYTALPNTFNCNHIGTNTVTLVVADAVGNTDTCTAIITIEDNLDPQIIGQNAAADLLGTGSVTIPVSSVNNGSSDNCSITNLTLTPDTFTNIGTYNAVLEGTDSSGNSDAISVEINIIDSLLNLEKQEFTDFSMYPNPANTTITIDGGENSVLKRLRIIDFTGKQIISKEIEQPSQKFSVDISNLESSVYFVSILDVNGGNVMKKLIKK